MTRFQNNITLPDIYDSSLEEKKILKFWNKEQIFKKITNARSEKNQGKLLFYSGPVFPTGFPHSGHIFNGLVKDVFTRYGHQKNLHVEGRFGWDCHGLPVEHKVEKKLEIKSPRDVQEMGVAAYNEECRKFVQRQTGEWKNVFERMGSCVDFTNEYRTMDTKYMESVWWVFKQLFDKDLVYRDTKVLPYSPGCFTNLSNFGAEQNCKEVTEVGVTISLNVVDSDEKLLIWTTTPWTLISNLHACVHPKAVYVKIKVKRKNKRDEVYILSKNSVQKVFKNPCECTVLEEFPGETLQNLKYEPLFTSIPVSSAFQIIVDDCVSDDIGTGIMPLDKAVVDSLRERGHILNVEEVKYKKPHCWRSDVPLINKRVPSWFIRVERLHEELLKNTFQVNWCPDSEIGEKHFINWLKEHPTDWSVSRTRTWGTPIPIWTSPSGDEVVCVGSIRELKQLTGKSNITDLHREHVDWMVIPSRIPGNPPLRRIPEVFDCWFESGAMPFSSRNYRKDFPESFQADFAAEGIDQTRGWFYTMLVLSTALSRPPPFRNVFVTGLVLEPDGSKVSKRKHNHNDPMRLIEKYGADALRLYLLNSPLSRCDDFTIEEEGVANIAEVVIKPFYRIFYQCTSQLGSPSWVNYGYVTEWYNIAEDIHHWILSCTESLIKFYDAEIGAHRLHTFLPEVIKLLRQVEDWYMAIERPDSEPAAVHRSSVILFNVIYRLCVMLAPFAPFITEFMYQLHRPYIIWCSRKESIHDNTLLPPNEKIINKALEVRFSRIQTIVEHVRALRVRHIIPMHYLIQELTVIHPSSDYMEDIMRFKETMVKLVNAQEFRGLAECDEIGAALKVKLKTSSSFSSNRKIRSAVENLDSSEISSLTLGGAVTLLEQSIKLEDIDISYDVYQEPECNCAFITKDDLIVVVKMVKSLSYYEEGTVKEIAIRIKNLKTDAGYYDSELVKVYYTTKDKCLQHAMNKHREHLNSTINCGLELMESSSAANVCGDLVEKSVDVKGMPMALRLHKKVVILNKSL